MARMNAQLVSIGGDEDVFDLYDENNMASDSDTGVPTQQSVKAYVDAQLSGAVAVKTTTTDVTAGANTWTAAEVLGGIMLRDPTGAARTDIFPTAALLVAAYSGATIGSAFEFIIRNTADVISEVITMSNGGAGGCTLTGLMTIIPGDAAHFLGVCTEVNPLAEAVTIYRVGKVEASSLGALRGIVTVTTDVTANANTWSAAEMVGGLMLRDPTGAARSDVTATAAALVAAITNAVVGSSFFFEIKNTADVASEIVTLTAGNGVTLSGNMTITPGNAVRFVGICTNVTGAAEAVTIYRLGMEPYSTVGTLVDQTVVTTDATAGANTWTAAELLGGLMLRSSSASRSDITPLATLIIAAMAGQAAIGNSFEFEIRNYSANATYVMTLTGDTGITLSGNMNIATGCSARFRCVQTAAATVTIYRLGEVVHSSLGNLIDAKTITTDATVGAYTAVAAALLGGLILRDPNGADRSDPTDTAANIIAAMGGLAAVGNSFEFAIRNTADADETITVTAGANVTLSGTVTIAQGKTRRFLCVVTGAATVTIYDLGNPTRLVMTVPLGFTHSVATVTGCLAVTQTMQVRSISVASTIKPADADGTITLAISNYDSSVTTDDNLLVAATFDLESIATAKIAEDLALTATGADLIVENGDFIYATVTSNGATIEGLPTGLCLTFIFDLL